MALSPHRCYRTARLPRIGGTQLTEAAATGSEPSPCAPRKEEHRTTRTMRFGTQRVIRRRDPHAADTAVCPHKRVVRQQQPPPAKCTSPTRPSARHPVAGPPLQRKGTPAGDRRARGPKVRTQVSRHGARMPTHARSLHRKASPRTQIHCIVVRHERAHPEHSIPVPPLGARHLGSG